MFIFSTKSMFPSAKALANKMSELMNRKVWVTTNLQTKLTGVSIRWGSSSPITNLSDFQGDLIAIASNKQKFSDKMVELDIPCVRIHRIYEIDNDTPGYPENYPVVVRTTLTGFGGAGIIVAKDVNEWYPHRYKAFSYFHHFKPELGVHIVNGKILKVFKKVATEDTPQEEYPIRNAARGYHFSLVNIDNYPKLVPFVQNFCEKFPILMGRMDVGWDVEAKTYRIIEFNTAPCLTNNEDTLTAYATELVDVVKSI